NVKWNEQKLEKIAYHICKTPHEFDILVHLTRKISSIISIVPRWYRYTGLDPQCIIDKPTFYPYFLYRNCNNEGDNVIAVTKYTKNEIVHYEIEKERETPKI